MHAPRHAFTKGFKILSGASTHLKPSHQCSGHCIIRISHYQGTQNASVTSFFNLKEDCENNMSREPSYPAIWSPIAGSIYRDEFRGNFAKGNEQIEAQLQDATDDLPAILLAKAIHRLVSGNIREAEQILDNIRAPDSGFDPSWQLRAELYRDIYVNDSTPLRPFDSCLNRPEFQMAVTNWLQIRRPSRLNDLNAAETPDHKLEKKWVNQYTWAVRLRSIAAVIPVTSPIHPKNCEPSQYRDMVDKLWQYFAASQQPGCSAGYWIRLQADIFHILESPNSLMRLRESAQAYRSNNDLIGEAACIMKEGDWICSSRYSNITALNMAVYESSTYNGGTSRWDSFEDELAIGQTNKAWSLYEEALEAFHRADAPRGIAAVHMRKACLRFFECLLSSKGGLAGDNEQYFKAHADMSLAHTTFLSAGDLLSSKLAEAHIIILGIYLSRSDGIAAAREIGKWGKLTNNMQFAHDLGLLLLRLGNYTWRKNRTFDKSRLLLQAAQALFKHLGAQISEIQAEASGAQMLFDILDFGSARISFLSAEAKLNDVPSYLVRHQVPVSLWENKMEIAKTTLACAMEPLFYYLGETNILRRLLNSVQDINVDPHDQEEESSRKPRFMLHLAKLRYKDSIREDDMSHAIKSLEKGFNDLSALDAKAYGDGREVGRINILIEMARYDEAKEILHKMQRSEDERVGSSTGIKAANLRDRQFSRTKNSEIMFNMAINVGDFSLANYYRHELEKLGNDQYSRKSANDPPKSSQVLRDLGSLHEGLGELEEAIININACLYAVETERSNVSDSSARMTSFGHNEVFEAFETAVRLCFKLHNTAHPKPHHAISCNPRLSCHSWIEQALTFAERGKARSMVDAIQDSLDRVSRDEKEGVNEQIIRNRKRLLIEKIAKSAKTISRLQEQVGFSDQRTTDFRSRLEEQLSAEEARLGMLEEEFARGQTDFQRAETIRALSGMRDYSQPLSIREAAGVLPSDTLVLEFSTTYNGVGIFVVGTSGIIANHWTDIQKIDLQKLVSEFLWFMRKENLEVEQRSERVNEIVQTLSEKLVKPVATALQDADNIILVPSGVLFNFPLGALEVSSEPLMLSFTTTQVPSLTVWQKLMAMQRVADQKPRTDFKASVLCNSPDVRESQLPYVRAEALAISKALSIKPIVADKVTAGRLREMARDSDVFHCSCHGEFDHDAPLLSNIQLHSETGSGDLSVMDIAAIIGPAKLVVLSACFSGFGKILGSNDGYGFAHALLSIGVRAFIGSLWNADDGSALIFMFVFYRELLGGAVLKEDNSGKNVSITQAFTSAQRQLRSISKAAYNDCIDSIICELKTIDPKQAKRVVGMTEQLFRLKDLKENRDPAKFADPFYWAAFVLTGNGLQNPLSWDSVGLLGNAFAAQELQ